MGKLFAANRFALNPDKANKIEFITNIPHSIY
jgi:hypothetical protein